MENLAIYREVKNNYKELLTCEENRVTEWWAYIETVPADVVKAVVWKMTEVQDRLKKFKNGFHYRTKIRAYCNLHLYSDAHPYEVVRVISDKTIEIRLMDTKQTKFPQEFIVGGFSAHCVDNYSQEYEYTSNENNPVIRIRKGKKGWGNGRYQMSDTPCKFHDYNF